MPIDYTDPRYLRFFIENVDKEQERRLRWFVKHKKVLYKRAKFPETYADIRTTEVSKASLGVYMPTFATDYRNGVVHYRQRPIRDGPIIGLSKLKPKGLKGRPTSGKVRSDSLMLPIEANVKNIHYQGLPCGGRVQYLKDRHRKIPEEKYYEDVTTSHVYGWRLKESEISRQAPTFGRFNSFVHDLLSRSGPHPDPPYYQKAVRYSKCYQ